MKKRINYKEKGITLVALVITIIILLILAGVTLTTALGQNGLFKRAKEASEKYKESEEQEKEAIDDIEKELDGIIPAGAGEKVSTPKGKDWDESKVDAVSDGEGNVMPVPKGFYYAGGSESTGFVISDKENDNLDNNGEGNQFVWIPCTETDYENAKGYVLDEEWSCNNGYKDNGASDGIQKTEGTGDGKGWRDYYIETDVDKLNEEYKDNTLPTEKWKNENQITKGKESIQKYGGFYIARYEAGIPDDANFSISQKESSAMSYVNTKNEVFSSSYVNDAIGYGRGSVADTGTIKDLKPVSKKGVQAWNYITQPNSKLVSENMYKESSSVNSYLVDSQAWNHICKNIFHAKKGEEANDSTAWGNYSNNTTTDYTKLNCLWAGHKDVWPDWTIATEYKTEKIKDDDIPKGIGEARIELSTGVSEDFKKYNIYDMAGNMWEWTTGHNVVTTSEGIKQMFIVMRGGSFIRSGDLYPVVRANGDDGLTHCFSAVNVGFRVVLYIE